MFELKVIAWLMPGGHNFVFISMANINGTGIA